MTEYHFHQLMAAILGMDVILTRIESRMDRIERRLDVLEDASPQAPAPVHDEAPCTSLSDELKIKASKDLVIDFVPLSQSKYINLYLRIMASQLRYRRRKKSVQMPTSLPITNLAPLLGTVKGIVK
jgi:hypothetical protein